MGLDDRILRMINRKDFTKLFWEEVQTNNLSYISAFDKINEEYMKATGRYRYASYKSFERANLIKDRRLC